MVGEDFSKALSSILGASSRKVTAVRLSHFPKASAPMLVTLLPILTLVRRVHSWKAKVQMLVTGISLMKVGMIRSPVAEVLQLVILTSSFMI
jgi:hypothetical protein